MNIIQEAKEYLAELEIGDMSPYAQDLISRLVDRREWKPIDEFAKNAPTKDDGWIEWRGGCFPHNQGLLAENMIEGKVYDGTTVKAFVVDARDWIWRKIIAYRIIDKPEPEKEKRYYGHVDKDGNYTFPERKVYKLSEMWKVWRKYDNIVSFEGFWSSREDANLATHRYTDRVAITRSNATEFYEGEGLD